MHTKSHPILKLILASMLLTCLASLPFAEESETTPSTTTPETKPQEVDEPLWLFDPAEEPLDLSELLKDLGEIPHLDDLPKNDLPKDVVSVQPYSSSESSASVNLVANDEPISIGENKKTNESAEKAPGQQPSNPLRSTQNKPAQTAKPSSTSQPISPSVATPAIPASPVIVLPPKKNEAPIASATEDKAKDGGPSKSKEPEEMPLMLDIPDELSEPKTPANSKPAENSPEPEIQNSAKSLTTSEPSARPRPKMVDVKPLTAEEQEAPSLSATNREIDVKQAREEDEKATAAKRPEANPKTFISKPSTGRITSQSSASTNPTDALRAQRVENCLAYYMANPESVVERSPWAVMHAMLPYGVEGEIMAGNRRVNSIQWMCYNGTCRTQKLFTPAGKYFRPNIGGGVQGHEGQFLSMLAQSQVGADYPIVVGNNKYTVTDLIRYEMATCVEKSELTFKLIGLSYYVDTNQVWLTKNRNRWNIEKLVAEELAQPIIGAACGGTHRLMGLTFAVRQRQAEGRPIDGQFARADRFVKEFVDYAWKLQNPDGSFSTNWFESRGNEPNMERKVQTTGHILEWLAFTLPEQELLSPRFTKSIDFLLSQVLDQRQHKWPIGPRGHATRAIGLYHQRTTGVAPGTRQVELAEEIRSLKINR